jgi:hypothetical protein
MKATAHTVGRCTLTMVSRSEGSSSRSSPMKQLRELHQIAAPSLCEKTVLILRKNSKGFPERSTQSSFERKQ